MSPRTSSSSSFGPIQVTLVTSAVYIALITILIWLHVTVPSAPDTATPAKGINLTQAWLDLEVVSDGFHPYDSRRNEVVREFLVGRIEEILEGNGKGEGSGEAVVFKEDVSNVTFVDDWRAQPWSCYSESSNLLVYIRGKRDEEGEWWEKGEGKKGRYEGPGGVLMNAHYDSVSSGFGATDDGVGVVTILQLISHFTSPGQQPERGIVALLNNGEENGLYGAHNYLQHPLSKFPHTFLNLEGAGAGGKATLFRSTDAEVTKQYAKSPNPYGTVVSGDGFKQGFIRSGTDYSVFVNDLGMRGLDVAFFAPRARYHTDEDDARDTSPDSLWHMLSASLATMQGLTSYSGDEFEGSTTSNGKLRLDKGHTGVWFDMLGQTFAVMPLSTLFALSVALLTAGPVLLIALNVVLVQSDKWYPFTLNKYLRSADDDQPVSIGGLKGFFRFPLAFIMSTAAVVALAFLQVKVNPYVVYSSEWAVWGMLLCAWFAVAWFFLAGSDRVRPSALQRFFCLGWVYAISWVVLVGATVGENGMGLGSGYFAVVYNASAWVALLISYLELFALPTKTKYVEHVADATEGDGRSTRPGSRDSRTLLSQSREPAVTAPADEEEATESTSLLRGRDRTGLGTFTGIGKRRRAEEDEVLEASDDPFLTRAYGEEQLWSSKLPQWTWIFQFIILAPINIIIVGQIALLLTTSLNQTPADGNPPLPVYLFLAAFTVLLMLPLTPFLHRFTYHIPTLLFLAFIGCLLYNLLAFPFSRDARLKQYFMQTIDLDTGINNVSLSGIDGYVQDVIAMLPSAAGSPVHCGLEAPSRRAGLQTCTWNGLAPHVVPADFDEVTPYHNHSSKEKNPYASWLDYNITSSNHSSSSSASAATFTFRGRNTKSCRLTFDSPVSTVSIHDSATDPRFNTVADDGTSEIHLFSRTWDKTFVVDVSWDDAKAKGQKGKVKCLWSDANAPETIPAYEEVRRFAPVWSGVTKAGDGLVEGWKGFEVR